MHSEEVTHDLLLSAAERVVDGAHRYVELVSGQRPPTVAPGPACRWCPVHLDIHLECAEGNRVPQRHLRSRRRGLVIRP